MVDPNRRFFHGDFDIVDEDLLTPEHYIIAMTFNDENDSFFLSVLKSLGDGHGFGNDAGVCTLPDDQDEYDIATDGKLEGIEFFSPIYDDIIIVHYDVMKYYLDLRCAAYLRRRPKDKKMIKGMLKKVEEACKSL